MVFAGIVLAAGRSSRFGKNKMLYPILGKPMVRWAVESMVTSKVDFVVVVTGHEGSRVAEALRDMPCYIVHNEFYIEGMSSSVKRGVSWILSVESGVKGVVILPGDCPFVKPKDINLVVDAYIERWKPIVIAAYKGRPGHPILIGEELFSELQRINEETKGLKGLVEKYRDKVELVETSSPEVLIDIDSEEDLKKLLNV